MAVKNVSVTEARALQEQGATYIDVRSTPEYEQGHPAGAVHVPLLEVDADTGQMMPNPDFARVVSANFSPDAPLLVGCQMGGRSMRAAEMLQESGFTDVANVRGGFGGARDRMTGRVVDAGWRESGLPVDDTSPPGGGYPDLLAKANTGR
jgi:rhodanese-related sulfurtransferase